MCRFDEGSRGKNAPRKGPGRGVAHWSGPNEERIFYISSGYRLIALNAQTGHPVPEFGNNGIVDLKTQLGQDLDMDRAEIGASAPPTMPPPVLLDITVDDRKWRYAGAGF